MLSYGEGFFFATLKGLTGRSELDLELSSHRTASEIFDELESRYPGLGAYRSSLLIAVNREYASWDRVIDRGDEIAFFPPVSGGQA